MIPLLLLAVSPIIIKALMGDITENKRKKNLYLTICGLCIVFVMGLRSRFSGSGDTNAYCKLFEDIKNSGIGFLDFINQRSADSSLLFSEVGFSVYVWLLANIFPNSQWLLIITAIIMTVCTLKFISKHSEDVMLSLIMFICLGLFTFNMNGLRQCIAMSICLLAYDHIKDKKFIPFVLLILLAMSFHKSALIFAFSYLLAFMKPKWNYVLFFITALALFITFADDISFLYDSMTGEDYSGGSSFYSGGIVVVAIYFIIITVSLLFNKKWDKQSFLSLLLVLMGGSFYIIRYLSTQIYERISYYFFYFTILLLPKVISEFDGKSKLLINSIVIVLSIALFAYRLLNTNFALIF